MTDKTDLIREIHEYVTAHGGENTATHLLVQAASVIQTQAAELEAVGAGGVQPLRSVQEGCKLVPLEPTQEMLAALMSPGEAEVLASSPSETFALMLMDRAGIRERYSAMLAASPTPTAEQPATTEAALGCVYAELPAPNLPRGGFPDLFTEGQMRGFADRTHALRMQAAPKAAPGDVLDEALRERDDAEDFIDALLDEVLGHERPEWSSSYGRADALNDVQERMTALHKPAVDKAWGRFQSAMAAPQQKARPCHVFTVRKAGGLTEWEPTTMALALPDGVHALYTLPQPSPHAHADSVTAPMRQGKWTWVPVEPSTAMLVAGNHGRPGDFSALKVWEDMLGALDRSFDYTRPVDPPSTNPPAQAADSVLEYTVLLKEARGALWQPANVALCERIDAYLDAARKQGADHDKT